MNLVLVGGHTRNIGKTSVMAELIRRLSPPGWTAAKITQYGHGICSQDGEPCGCAPEEHAFAIEEETDATGPSDTSRFLAAGAKRSLWVRAREGQLAQALPALLRALQGEDWVMAESNSLRALIEPALYLVVLDPARPDFKASALRWLESADALVRISSRLEARSWTGVDARMLEGKPVFPVAAGPYASRELCRFVRERLRLPESFRSPAQAASREESPWLH